VDIFSGKIVIVTGAASGIGRVLSEEMARRGAYLIMADLNGPLLDEAVEAIKKTGGPARAVKLDVSDFAAVKRMVDDATAEHGRLDYLFNNAGIGIFGEAQDFSYEDWRRVIDTNLYGAVNGVAAAYPVMVKQGFGHIINTASLAGIVPVTGVISYTASKHGVVGLSHALRIEGADLGVRVSVVCPGIIDTPILHTSKLIKIDGQKASAALPKAMAPEICAQKILRGVERNRTTIVVTGFARSQWLLQRISPALVRWIWGRNMRKLRGMRSEG